LTASTVTSLLQIYHSFVFVAVRETRRISLGVYSVGCPAACSLFQLLLMELVPGTSIVTPLIGKYLLFTCILVSISVITSVFVLNLTQRSSGTHNMPAFIRRAFVDALPRLLCMQRPVEAQRADVDFSQAHSELLPFDNPYKKVKIYATLRAVTYPVGA